MSLFVAISKFAVANGMTAEVKQAFVNRPHLVDGAEGFVRMGVEPEGLSG
jgi:heme oxygenase (mycobilin-producing)